MNQLPITSLGDFLEKSGTVIDQKPLAVTVSSNSSTPFWNNLIEKLITTK